MKKTLITLIFIFSVLNIFGQKTLMKLNQVEKFGWKNSSYWMNFYSKDTSTMVSIEYDSSNSLQSISSSYASSNFIPKYDSTLSLPDFKENGSLIEFYENHIVKSVKTFYLVIPICTWIYYFPSGKVNRIENYPKDTLIYKLCESYQFSTSYGNKNNPVGFNLKTTKGLPHGEWIEFYENGNLKYKKHFQMGLADGEWIWYYENKKTMKSGQFYKKYDFYPCKIDLKIDDISNQDENSEDNFINIQPKHGQWKYCDKNGNLLNTKEYKIGVLIK